MVISSNKTKTMTRQQRCLEENKKNHKYLNSTMTGCKK